MKATAGIQKQSYSFGVKSKSYNDKLPWWWSLVFLSWIGLTIGLTFIAYYKLPKPLDKTAGPEHFIGERAKRYLNDLTSFGCRPVGSSANEIATVNYLIKEIELIRAESNGLYDIETSTQLATGSARTSTMYDSIQNVIVKLTPIDSNQTNALLLNSHFDTVPGSHGAGDDGTMVAVMLGILSALTKSQNAVRHPIIFLFNGAEETGLQGAHAFISQHSWRKDAKFAINLEGMGVGGREILFRSGPENIWLLEEYAKAATYPFASVIGEEIFDSGLIPSNTDFTIFNNYGLPGLDFAHIYRGYLYHTTLDTINFMDEGTLQHTGDNILALTRSVANAQQLDKGYVPNSTGKSIYFDVFGLFMLVYSSDTGRIVNYSIAAIALVLITVSIFLVSRVSEISLFDVNVQFALSFGLELVSLALGAGFVLGLSFFLDAVDFSMRWYSQPWLIFGLYFCPFIFIAGMVPAVFIGCKRFNQLPLKFSVLMLLNANCVIFVILIVALTVLNIRSTFLLTCIIVFYILPLTLNIIFGFYKTDRVWVFAFAICQAVPVAFISYIAEVLCTVFIPISGRQTENPETMLAIFSVGLCILMFSFMIPLFSAFQRAKTIIASILMVFVVFFILAFTDVCFPYSANGTPQRQSVIHSQRARYNSSGDLMYEDAIYLMYKWDRYSMDTLKDVSRSNDFQLLSSLQDDSGLQYYSNNYALTKATPPSIPEAYHVKLLLDSKETLLPTSVKYNFHLSGPKFYRIFISPLNNAMLEHWSFTSKGELNSPRSQYTLNLRFGNVSHSADNPYEFWISMQVRNASSNALSIGIVGSYLEEESPFTSQFVKFIESFPDWTSVTPQVESFDSFIF